MSVTETFDKWYTSLSDDEKNEILKHIINKKCQIACEGFYAGPAGTTLRKGLFVAPSGNVSLNKCPVCGK